MFKSILATAKNKNFHDFCGKKTDLDGVKFLSSGKHDTDWSSARY